MKSNKIQEEDCEEIPEEENTQSENLHTTELSEFETTRTQGVSINRDVLKFRTNQNSDMFKTSKSYL